jgi:hypothetical protein
MKYNHNYKYRQKQSERSIRRAKERKEDMLCANKFFSKITDKTWWRSLSFKQKQKVADNYHFCEKYGDDGDSWFSTYSEDPLDKIVLPVTNKKQFLIWENAVKEIVGDKKKIRNLKLKEIGIIK